MIPENWLCQFITILLQTMCHSSRDDKNARRGRFYVMSVTLYILFILLHWVSENLECNAVWTLETNLVELQYFLNKFVMNIIVLGQIGTTKFVLVTYLWIVMRSYFIKYYEWSLNCFGWYMEQQCGQFSDAIKALKSDLSLTSFKLLKLLSIGFSLKWWKQTPKSSCWESHLLCQRRKLKVVSVLHLSGFMMLQFHNYLSHW